jgi:transcriptional regulator with XRE-family HTH domain
MNIIINYKQCKAARMLLDWNQEELCKRAGITKSTIGDFKRGARNLRIETMQKVVGVFEDNGIRFEGEKGRILVELNPTFKQNCDLKDDITN